MPGQLCLLSRCHGSCQRLQRRHWASRPWSTRAVCSPSSRMCSATSLAQGLLAWEVKALAYEAAVGQVALERSPQSRGADSAAMPSDKATDPLHKPKMRVAALCACHRSALSILLLYASKAAIYACVFTAPVIEARTKCRGTRALLTRSTAVILAVDDPIPSTPFRARVALSVRRS